MTEDYSHRKKRKPVQRSS